MNTQFDSAYLYTEANGLAGLRTHAQHNPDSPETIDAIARQFEALFIQMMLKTMRDAMPVDSGMRSDHTKMFESMYDQQIALDMSRGQGIGMREALVRDLTPHAPPDPNRELTMPEHRVPALRSALEVIKAVREAEITEENNTDKPVQASLGVAASAVPSEPQRRNREISVAEGEIDRNWRPQNAEEFIRDLWPHAQNAAKQLGVEPEVLIAQSALETGWGRHMIRHGDGRNSFNLFGIKADRSWQGDRANVSTLEYVNGAFERQRAYFRSYQSPAESFEDYVNFLQSNPRYRDALKVTHDAEAYLRGLQRAGYATDPAYANKILNILNRGSLPQTLSALEAQSSNT